jgi:hypothetical protein
MDGKNHGILKSYGEQYVPRFFIDGEFAFFAFFLGAKI